MLVIPVGGVYGKNTKQPISFLILRDPRFRYSRERRSEAKNNRNSRNDEQEQQFGSFFCGAENC